MVSIIKLLMMKRFIERLNMVGLFLLFDPTLNIVDLQALSSFTTPVRKQEAGSRKQEAGTVDLY